MTGWPRKGWRDTAWQSLWPSLLTLAVAGTGGLLISFLQIPIAWMVGAMLATAIAASMRLPIRNTDALRPPVRAILGCVLGSNITPDIGARIAEWAVPVAGQVVSAGVMSVTGWLILRRIGRLNPATAIFGAVPGGLIEMTLLADRNDGDPASIAVLHTVRIFAVILSMPFIIVTMTGLDSVTGGPATATPATLDAGSLLWFAGCALGGIAVGRALRLPSPDLFGALLLSGVAHFAGWTHFVLPGGLLAVVQVVMGATVGIRFLGMTWRLFAKLAWLSGAIVIAQVAILCVVAVVVARATGLEFLLLVLAYAPAGLNEMTLITIAIGRDAVFVAVNHLVRVFGILLICPPAYARIYGRERSP